MQARNGERTAWSTQPAHYEAGGRSPPNGNSERFAQTSSPAVRDWLAPVLTRKSFLEDSG